MIKSSSHVLSIYYFLDTELQRQIIFRPCPQGFIISGKANKLLQFDGNNTVIYLIKPRELGWAMGGSHKKWHLNVVVTLTGRNGSNQEKSRYFALKKNFFLVNMKVYFLYFGLRSAPQNLLWGLRVNVILSDLIKYFRQNPLRVIYVSEWLFSLLLFSLPICLSVFLSLSVSYSHALILMKINTFSLSGHLILVVLQLSFMSLYSEYFIKVAHIIYVTRKFQVCS